LQDKGEALDAEERRLTGQSDRPPPATASRSQATPLAMRLRSVASYIDLRYEQETRRILESYEGKARMTKFAPANLPKARHQ
jgi:hypothetical protein